MIWESISRASCRVVSRCGDDFRVAADFLLFQRPMRPVAEPFAAYLVPPDVEVPDVFGHVSDDDVRSGQQFGRLESAGSCEVRRGVRQKIAVASGGGRL